MTLEFRSRSLSVKTQARIQGFLLRLLNIQRRNVKFSSFMPKNNLFIYLFNGGFRRQRNFWYFKKLHRQITSKDSMKLFLNRKFCAFCSRNYFFEPFISPLQSNQIFNIFLKN